MSEMLAVRLSVEQIRLLAQVTELAGIDEARNAHEASSNKAKEQYGQRAARLNELADIFRKTCP